MLSLSVSMCVGPRCGLVKHERVLQAQELQGHLALAVHLRAGILT